MTTVRQFYVDNPWGDLPATLKAAHSPNGAVYPPGSLIQLVPGEVMVKRKKRFNPATRDRECEMHHGCKPPLRFPGPSPKRPISSAPPWP